MPKSTWRAPQSSSQRKRKQRLIAGLVGVVVLALVLTWALWPEEEAVPAPDQNAAVTAVQHLSEYPAVRVQGTLVNDKGDETGYTATRLVTGGVIGNFNSATNGQPVDYVISDEGVTLLHGTTYLWDDMGVDSDWSGWAVTTNDFITPDFYLDPDTMLTTVTAANYDGYRDGLFVYKGGVSIKLDSTGTRVEKVIRGDSRATVHEVSEADAAKRRTEIDTVVTGEVATLDYVNTRWVVRTPEPPAPAPSPAPRGGR